MSRSRFVIILLVAIFFSACKKKERASRKPLEGNKTEYLLAQMSNNVFDFDTFSAKADFTFEKGEKRNSFKANIRIKKDSLIWISITPLLGIEVGRVMITQDTVKVINRIDKEYFIGGYSYLENRFNVDLEFEVVQSLLLGNMIAFEPNEKLNFAIDKEYYYLGNLKKRKAKKADEKPQKIERQDDQVMSLWLDQNSFKIREFLLSDPNADRFIMGNYDEHFEVEGQLFPKQLKFEIQSDSPAEIEIDYSRVYLDKSLNFSFNISSKYEQVYY